LQELDIPLIAVMGDQSTGKSSVLEAISGVRFPRGQGTVTKCATEVRMRRGPERIQISRSNDLASKVVVGSVSELEGKITELTEELLAARGSGAGFEPTHNIIIEHFQNLALLLLYRTFVISFVISVKECKFTECERPHENLLTYMTIYYIT
jgi:GTPase SAR1 family protein